MRLQGRKLGTGLAASLLALAVSAAPAIAQDQTQSPLIIPALTLPLGRADLTLDAAARGTLFSASQPGSAANIAGVAKLMPRLQRDFDSGLSLAFAATLAVHDRLSFGRYDGDILEKAYGEAHVLLSTVRVGLVDGAAADLSVAGPVADTAVALNDPSSTFFRDSSGGAVANIFTLRTPSGPSSNYAKILLESPTLFGVQLAISFAPSEGKNVLPLLAAGPQVAGRQADMWEGAVRYSDDFGPISITTYGGASFGRAEHKLPGQRGVSDFGLGARADYPVNDALTLSLGGGWHQSNAYAFDINRSYADATTEVLDASAGATWGPIALSLEHGNGTAGAVAGNARLALNGSEAAVAYTFSDSMLASLGWQHLSYGRDSGAFYDGSRHLSLDAVFLHLSLRTSHQQ